MDWVHCYLETIPNPMKRGKVRAALTAQFGLDGVRGTRAHHIEFLIASGYQINADGNLEKPGEPGYFRKKDFGVIALDYAEFLLGIQLLRGGG